MRKIDAVLLSALIIYDYSAQSLADTETVNLGHSFTTEYKQEKNWMDSIAIASIDNTTSSDDENVYRGVTRIMPEKTQVESSTTISYHELANINTEAVEEVAVVSEAENVEAVTISIPDASLTDIAIEAPETEVTEAVAEVAEIASKYTMETVAVSEKQASVDPSQLDTDNDGVFDYEDKCQGTAGVARFEGCPVPDSDADGVNDEEDRCPYQAGTLENGGCAVVTETAVQVLSNEVTEAKPEAIYQNLMSFNFSDGTLVNKDFNKLLQFADELVRNSEKKLEITQFAENVNTSKIISYLKDLGVQKSQVVVITKVNEGGENLKDKINIELGN